MHAWQAELSGSAFMSPHSTMGGSAAGYEAPPPLQPSLLLCCSPLLLSTAAAATASTACCAYCEQKQASCVDTRNGVPSATLL